MKKIGFFFKITIIVIFLDFILTFFLISRLDFYDIFYPKLDHRIANNVYHHSFKENVNTYDYWGKFRYKFITNSLGFKDRSNQHIKVNTDLNKRIIINGDSFTEGIGFEYDDTFVGLLDNYLYKKNIEILNAGVASQSPILYLKKIKYLIEVQKIKFDELIIFLDISDIPDEYYYNRNFDNDIKINSFKDISQEFLLKYLSSYLFFDIIFSKLDILKENLFVRFQASNEFNISFSDITEEQKNLYKSINVERGNWTHDEFYWSLHGIQGQKLAEKNLDELYNLCNKHNIKLTLIIYPWPSQIYFNHQSIRHQIHWKKWTDQRNIKFIDLFDYFDDTEPKEIIKKYFIPGDVHWNKDGHQFIYNIIKKEYFE